MDIRRTGRYTKKAEEAGNEIWLACGCKTALAVCLARGRLQK